MAMSCGVVRRCGWYLALLRLWYRLAATALTQPLAWESPCAVGVAHKTKKANNGISRNFRGGKLIILKFSNTKGIEKKYFVELKIALNFQQPTSGRTDISEI